MDCNGGKWRIVGNGALLRGGFVMPNPISYKPHIVKHHIKHKNMGIISQNMWFVKQICPIKT
jgi:hypothetical protein